MTTATEKVVNSPTVTALARLCMVALVPAAIAAGGYFGKLVLDGLFETKVAIAELRGDVKQLSAVTKVTKENRDQWASQTDERLRYLERLTRR